MFSIMRISILFDLFICVASKRLTPGEKAEDSHHNLLSASNGTMDFEFAYGPFLIPRPLFLNKKDEEGWERLEKSGGNGGVERSGGNALKLDEKCKKFVPGRGEAGDGLLAVCDDSSQNGYWKDVLFLRPNEVVPLQTCEALKKSGIDKSNPPPMPGAAADILAYETWSFQHFLDNAATVAQNVDIYRKYNVKLLADIRQNSGSYDNPLVPKMLEKTGLLPQMVPHCNGWNTEANCVDHEHAKIALGCSRPPFVPSLGEKFRDLMGVNKDLPTKGHIVLILRKGGDINNCCRRFVNEAEVVDAVKGVAKERGMDVTILDKPIKTSMADVTNFFGKASLLVGAHGGALYNTWFMPRGAGLLELEAREGWTYFWPQAARLGQVYAVMRTEAKDSTRPFESDMTVNKDGLVSMMHKVLDNIKANAGAKQ